MKRSCLLPLLLAICLALCGCTTVVCNGPEYRLLKENGSYYIQFHTDYSHEKYNASLPEDGSRPPFYPTYTTAAELREALLDAMHPKLVRIYWPVKGAIRTLREAGIRGLMKKRNRRDSQ